MRKVWKITPFFTERGLRVLWGFFYSVLLFLKLIYWHRISAVDLTLQSVFVCYAREP